MGNRKLAVIGSVVGAATAGVIVVLVVQGDPKAAEPATTLAERAAAIPELPTRPIEGGLVKPWDAKPPTAEELAAIAEAEKAKQAEADAERKKAEQALAQAERQAALDQARLQQGGAFASLTGTGDISSGFDDAFLSSHANISGGLGRAWTGAAGGGGTIGTGRYGQIGSGVGGTGLGYGRGSMRRRPGPSTTIGQPSAVGDLDKAIIRRYIKRETQKIQYCYEKQLLNNPKLAGSITVKFTITPSGTVTGASASGVDAEVSSCIAAVVEAIAFPKPKNGSVVVSYPFTFRPEAAP